jgi:uncharacterized membrane protein (DUF2068 family)
MIETSEEPGQSVEPAAIAATDSVSGESGRAPRARGLLLIGLFKLGKALFFLGVGIGALHLVHRNIGDLFLKVESMLHLDPEGRLVGMLEDKADLISGYQLRRLGFWTLMYAGLSMVEGVGLMMEQTWAEYLTLTLTIGALPFDLYGLISHPTSVRASVVLINLAVLAYLLWFIRWHRRQEWAEAAKTE